MTHLFSTSKTLEYLCRARVHPTLVHATTNLIRGPTSTSNINWNLRAVRRRPWDPVKPTKYSVKRKPILFLRTELDGKGRTHKLCIFSCLASWTFAPIPGLISKHKQEQFTNSLCRGKSKLYYHDITIYIRVECSSSISVCATLTLGTAGFFEDCSHNFVNIMYTSRTVINEATVNEMYGSGTRFKRCYKWGLS